ncbi:MAG: phosphoribosylformylglycinamidine synthase subunit PurS [Calditrichota bacterium]
MRVRVSVRLKPAILDPQGKTVLQAAHQLGFREVTAVRMGKLIEIEVTGDNPSNLRSRMDELCRKLLANPLMENYDVIWETGE